MKHKQNIKKSFVVLMTRMDWLYERYNAYVCIAYMLDLSHMPGYTSDASQINLMITCFRYLLLKLFILSSRIESF